MFELRSGFRRLRLVLVEETGRLGGRCNENIRVRKCLETG